MKFANKGSKRKIQDVEVEECQTHVRFQGLTETKDCKEWFDNHRLIQKDRKVLLHDVPWTHMGLALRKDHSWRPMNALTEDVCHSTGLLNNLVDTIVEYCGHVVFSIALPAHPDTHVFGTSTSVSSDVKRVRDGFKSAWCETTVPFLAAMDPIASTIAALCQPPIPARLNFDTWYNICFSNPERIHVSAELRAQARVFPQLLPSASGLFFQRCHLRDSDERYDNQRLRVECNPQVGETLDLLEKEVAFGSAWCALSAVAGYADIANKINNQDEISMANSYDTLIYVWNLASASAQTSFLPIFHNASLSEQQGSVQWKFGEAVPLTFLSLSNIKTRVLWSGLVNFGDVHSTTMLKSTVCRGNNIFRFVIVEPDLSQ